LTAHALIPSLLIRKYVCVLGGSAGFGHHVSHRIAPFLIMGGFFVTGRIIGCTVCFYQNKAGWLILLLQDIKSGDTWFLFIFCFPLTWKGIVYY
jgi:hypothetical protein